MQTTVKQRERKMFFEYEGIINCTNGDILKERLSINEKEASNNVTAVYIDALIKPKYASSIGCSAYSSKYRQPKRSI